MVKVYSSWLAGAVSATFVGYLLSWTNNDWTLTFYISAAIYSIGGLCWLLLDAQTPLEQPTAGAA